jgi:hypothetical protein
MKKYIISGIAVLAIAAVAAWNVSMNSQNSALSDIQLANVEALADGEGTPHYDCPNGNTECVRVRQGSVIIVFFKE